MDQRGGKTDDIEVISALISDSSFLQIDSRFSRFCPFEAVGMVRAEIRHSNFLGYILNPFRPHGFDTALLGAFLKRALSKSEVNWIEYETLRDAEIRREWRNIDLLILLPKARRVIAIELKIDASQSHGQLEKYRRIIEASWPACDGWKREYLFVAKYDETPNDAAWTKFKLHELVDAFEVVAESDAYRHAPAIDILRSYILMMRRHHLGDRELERLARELWSRQGEALAFLVDRRPDPLQEMLDQIRDNSDAFLSKIAPAHVPMMADKHSKKILRFAFGPWDELTDFKTAQDWTATGRLVLLEVKLAAESLRAQLVIGPGSTDSRDAYVARLPVSGRGQYIFAADEELLKLNAEVEISFEGTVAAVARFAQRVFDEFDPALRMVSESLRESAGIAD